MNQSQTPASTRQSAPRLIAAATAPKITTEEAAERMRNRPQTWRAGYCREGHFHGLIPAKLPSRRLLWNADEVDALIAGLPVKTPDAADLDKHTARKAEAKIPEHITRKSAEKLKRLAAAATAGEVA
jgi:hypothetical protein